MPGCRRCPSTRASWRKRWLRVVLLRLVDDAHAALAEHAEDAVLSETLGQSRGGIFDVAVLRKHAREELCPAGVHGCVDRRVVAGILGEHRLDLGPQVVVVARLGEERGPLVGRQP
ncbi:MAG: hypothetical protein ACYTGP_05620, partial [Planctomycetota bacterium]